MKPLREIFNVKYGTDLELNALEKCAPDSKYAANFVSRTAKNNGVSAIVERLSGIEPISAGTITVACGGSVLETFLQSKPYYSGRDILCLTPLAEMSECVKLYYCACIRANKYRYNYGRQANKTLKDILLPETSEIPNFVHDVPTPDYSGMREPFAPASIKLDCRDWKPFEYSELFEIERGTGPRKQDIYEGTTPFVTAIDSNNGITTYCNYIPTHKGNSIGVNRNGSIAEAFYQEQDFCSTEDVHIFHPKFEMNKYIAMFFITLIRQEKYRYNYGRKWGVERMNASTIRLPATPMGKPDFTWMERYIQSLGYSTII